VEHGRECGALVFVTATGTETGKTWWAAAIAREARARGLTVLARKPAQSYAPGDPETDADVLAAATGEDPRAVCPEHRCYDVPLAPPMAAEALGRPAFGIADLTAELSWPGRPDLVLVEGAGGPRSPIARDGDNVDLARALAPSFVVLVAPAGLGTINAVRLCADALAPLRLAVALNRYAAVDDLHELNRSWLSDRDGLTVVTEPAALVDVLVDVVRDEPPRAAQPGRGRSRTGRG
jgi:dethiobiotin synthetase